MLKQLYTRKNLSTLSMRSYLCQTFNHGTTMLLFAVDHSIAVLFENDRER